MRGPDGWVCQTSKRSAGPGSAIVQKLESVEDELRALMSTAEEAAVRRRELAEAQERYHREEDQRRVAQALADGMKQLAGIMEKWAAATAVERFFLEAQSRIGAVEGERRPHLDERLARARLMVGPLDSLAFLAEWLAPEERYKSKYGQSESRGLLPLVTRGILSVLGR